ncbi:hypothetical protein AVEN_82995-1 [Araneus ventricosus]|uniref:Uncharacterized protein n=1 Tax=Araneus ventricosus TaxID=182803 RepID=A0A4Y2GQJ0_ARAVE|nr:hypothetical protein AVEN_82995-1 [Araneus ventricosus]
MILGQYVAKIATNFECLGIRVIFENKASFSIILLLGLISPYTHRAIFVILYILDTIHCSPLEYSEDTSYLQAQGAVVHTVLTATNEKTEILKKAAKDDSVLVLI